MKSLKTLSGTLLSYLMLMILVVGCKTTSKTSNRSSSTSSAKSDKIIKSSDINSLIRTMTGSYTSAAQAKDDTTYFDITLHMYPIWTSQESKYLYVEQAVTADPGKPYRQRVYRVEADGNGGFESHIYTLADDERFIGKWKEPAFFDQFGEELLSVKEGCTVYLSKHGDGSYSGSTRMDHCKSTMRGASYATSMVKIRDNSVMSWDQGFDAEGLQVWGAEKGGYRFVKVAN